MFFKTNLIITNTLQVGRYLINANVLLLSQNALKLLINFSNKNNLSPLNFLISKSTPASNYLLNILSIDKDHPLELSLEGGGGRGGGRGWEGVVNTIVASLNQTVRYSHYRHVRLYVVSLEFWVCFHWRTVRDTKIIYYK